VFAKGWDLTALVNAADAKAPQVERHLWMVRTMEWLRHAPASGRLPSAAAAVGERATPLPVLRLRLLLNLLDQQPALREQVQGTLQAFWREIDAATLFADFGYSARQSLFGEVIARLREQVLPGTPQTSDLVTLFQLLFDPDDIDWIEALDTPTLQRAAALLAPAGQAWRGMLLDGITMLVSAVRAAAFSPALRLRMDRALLHHEPFRQLSGAAETLRGALLDGRLADALQSATLLRALLAACRAAAGSVPEHLEEFGVSVDIVHELDQLHRRTLRIERLVDCLLAPDPLPELRLLLVHLLRIQRERRGVRRVLARHYGLLARLVAERSAETGEHYITRDREEYVGMLRSAAGGGAVIAGTTFVKFAVAALGMTVFWTGFWSGVNYAVSFVVVMLLHWTVATKQPAMTAPALAASLPSSGGPGGRQGDGETGGEMADDGIEVFVDRVAQLIRSQAAGIIGNLAICGPLVLLLQWAGTQAFGQPLVGTASADYVLHSLTLLGPTALFAAFTGVLLFASSLVAGWAENWFVFHRLDSAIAWNPRIVARLGATRAQRWSRWWRNNISGLAGNISLGMMLGLVPALAAIVGLPIEVRHVTLSTGQLGAAIGAIGWPVFGQPALWWCVAGIAVTGVLNVGVSFGLAFSVALRSRGLKLKDRERIARAVLRRLRTRPLSFVLPPKADRA
jgi:site-specific recombinase